MTPGKPPYTVSPSRIARYYFQECERYLRYSSPVGARRRKAEGIPPKPFDTRPVTRAILESGYAWEEDVVRELIADRVHIAVAADPDQPVRARVFDAEATKEKLGELGPGEYVYQPTLITPERFYTYYGIDRAVVSMSECRPDLVECVEEDGDLRLRVIDVKASPGLKLSHKIQATVYTLILDHLLEEWGLDDHGMAGVGGVWLAQQPEPEFFDVRSMRPPLETFFRDELQPLMGRPAADAHWHVYYRCEWCDYFQHYQEEMRRTDDVSRVPYLSTHAKRYLGELTPPVRTVADFQKLLADRTRLPLLDDSASLRGRGDAPRSASEPPPRSSSERRTASNLARS